MTDYTFIFIQYFTKYFIEMQIQLFLDNFFIILKLIFRIIYHSSNNSYSINSSLHDRQAPLYLDTRTFWVINSLAATSPLSSLMQRQFDMITDAT